MLVICIPHQIVSHKPLVSQRETEAPGFLSWVFKGLRNPFLFYLSVSGLQPTGHFPLFTASWLGLV